MIPTLSTDVERGPYVEVQNRRSRPLIDFEMGSSALNTSGSEFNQFLWTAETDGSTVRVYRDGVEPVVVTTDTGITQIALGFDQTMRPHIAYMAGGVCKFYWFNSLTSSMETRVIEGARTPRLCMDEKRALEIGNSDLLLSYKVGTSLCLRAQRERFMTEHVLATDVPGDLIIFGLNTKNRLQWKLVGET